MKINILLTNFKTHTHNICMKEHFRSELCTKPCNMKLSITAHSYENTKTTVKTKVGGSMCTLAWHRFAITNILKYWLKCTLLKSLVKILILNYHTEADSRTFLWWTNNLSDSGETALIKYVYIAIVITRPQGISLCFSRKCSRKYHDKQWGNCTRPRVAHTSN